MCNFWTINGVTIQCDCTCIDEVQAEKKENSEAELCMNCLAFMLYIYVKYLEANIVDVGLLNFFD